MITRILSSASLAVALLASTAMAANLGLESGSVSLKSVGPMTFATGGVLLVGDPKEAAIYAIDTEDSPADASSHRKIDDIAKAIGASLKSSGDVSIGELAVNPETGNAFLTVRQGDTVRLVKVAGDNTISEVTLSAVKHAKKALPNPPEDRAIPGRRGRRNPRDQSITDLAFFEGKVMVTGMSADDSPSQVIEFPFPFASNSVATSVDIFHAAHGRYEDATIRTFLPIVIDGKPNLLAGFTCTPLVRFPVDDLKGKDKVRGTTVAELGNRNQPLDMIVYQKDGETSVLMNNSARGMMKITTAGIATRDGLTEPVRGGGTAGQPFETIDSLSNVRQMDKLDDDHALALVEENGTLSLTTIELP